MRIRRSKERGRARLDWLDTAYTFSFADYHDPEFLGYGPLRVINQDHIAAGRGFGRHGHRNMEIVTVVLDGALRHGDSLENSEVLRPGEVQFMSAGRGVHHSEFNASDDTELHLLQMWVHPRTRDGDPRYEQRGFGFHQPGAGAVQVLSPDGAEGSLIIDQDARLFVGYLAEGEAHDFPAASGRSRWFHLADGRVGIGNETLASGDGAAMDEATKLEIVASEPSRYVLWGFPSVVS